MNIKPKLPMPRRLCHNRCALLMELLHLLFKWIKHFDLFINLTKYII